MHWLCACQLGEAKIASGKSYKDFLIIVPTTDQVTLAWAEFWCLKRETIPLRGQYSKIKHTVDDILRDQASTSRRLSFFVKVLHFSLFFIMSYRISKRVLFVFTPVTRHHAIKKCITVKACLFRIPSVKLVFCGKRFSFVCSSKVEEWRRFSTRLCYLSNDLGSTGSNTICISWNRKSLTSSWKNLS